MKKKYRMMELDKRFYIHVKSLNTFYRWKKVDYYYDFDSAQRDFARLTNNPQGIVLKETNWIK